MQINDFLAVWIKELSTGVNEQMRMLYHCSMTETKPLPTRTAARRGRPRKADHERRGTRVQVKFTDAEVDHLRAVALRRCQSVTQMLLDGVRTLTALEIADAIRLRAEASSRRRVKVVTDDDKLMTIELDTAPAGSMPDDVDGLRTYTINDYERAIRRTAVAIAAERDVASGPYTPPNDVVFLLPSDHDQRIQRIVKYGQAVTTVAPDPNGPDSNTNNRQS